MRTFLDTGLPIAAWKGEEPARSIAWQILEDEQRHLIASPFLRLETLPKAKNKGSQEEVRFLEFVYSLVREWVPVDTSLVERAIELGILYQLRNIDTIHAASAERAGVEQFVTAELPGKPFFKVPKLKAVHLLAAME